MTTRTTVASTIRIEVVRITPELAADWLNKNPTNRDLRPGHAEVLARDIIANKWILNAETIKIGPNGEIIDGQHRLYACIEANMPFTSLVAFNVPLDAMNTIDTGIPRTWADQFKIRGKQAGGVATYAAEMQATLRNLHWYETAWPALMSGFKKRASHSELNSLEVRNPTLHDRVSEVACHQKLRNLGSPAATCMVYYLASLNYPNEARAWLEALRTGEGASENPAIVLREKLIAKQLQRSIPLDVNQRLVYLIKSWNAFARKEEISALRWGPEEPMPAIFGTPQYTGKLAAHTAILKKKKAAGPLAKGPTSTMGKRQRKQK